MWHKNDTKLVDRNTNGGTHRLMKGDELCQVEMEQAPWEWAR